MVIYAKKADKPYIRKVQTSVTCFLFNGDDYLFIKRNMDKRVDPGKLNGIGGRLEPGENFLDAAVREVKEETGYEVKPENLTLSGIVKLEGGYQEDWVMCFFKIKLASKEIPKGTKTEDGELMWIHKDKVLDSGYQLVDDLNYSFKDIIEGKEVFFMTAKVNADEKIYDLSMSKLKV
jgi:8-oxo-dGTP pyrophosphatase MutT (NUDIX family)